MSQQIIIDPIDVTMGRVKGADQDLGNKILTILNRHYPGHNWAVQPSHHRGIVTIRNYSISLRFGAVMKIANLANEIDLQRKVREFGGEFLERARLARGPLRPGSYREAIGRVDWVGVKGAERLIKRGHPRFDL